MNSLLLLLDRPFHSMPLAFKWDGLSSQTTTGPTALYKTPACLTTHLGTSSGVQFVLIDQKLNHFNEALLSCSV